MLVGFKVFVAINASFILCLMKSSRTFLYMGITVSLFELSFRLMRASKPPTHMLSYKVWSPVGSFFPASLKSACGGSARSLRLGGDLCGVSGGDDKSSVGRRHNTITTITVSGNKNNNTNHGTGHLVGGAM